MIEKPKGVNERQQNGGSKPDEKKPAKMSGPLVERAPPPTKKSRLKDNEMTVPLIYPPDLLETQKPKQSSDKNSNNSNDDKERESVDENDRGAEGGEALGSTQTSEPKSFIARLKFKFNAKKDE